MTFAEVAAIVPLSTVLEQVLSRDPKPRHTSDVLARSILTVALRLPKYFNIVRSSVEYETDKELMADVERCGEAYDAKFEAAYRLRMGSRPLREHFSQFEQLMRDAKVEWPELELVGARELFKLRDELFIAAHTFAQLSRELENDMRDDRRQALVDEWQRLQHTAKGLREGPGGLQGHGVDDFSARLKSALCMLQRELDSFVIRRGTKIIRYRKKLSPFRETLRKTWSAGDSSMKKELVEKVGVWLWRLAVVVLLVLIWRNSASPSKYVRNQTAVDAVKRAATSAAEAARRTQEDSLEAAANSQSPDSKKSDDWLTYIVEEAEREKRE
jgi:hypothetical protein